MLNRLRRGKGETYPALGLEKARELGQVEEHRISSVIRLVKFSTKAIE
jgi:hypothetical protein